MMLWLIFALMTVAAVCAVLWPFGRKRNVTGGGSDRLVYQDQLLEIERDRAAGLIGVAEAESARVEISRRLLAAADAESSAQAAPSAQQFAFRHRAAAVVAAILLPAVGLGLYATLGSPDIPSQSAFARVDTPIGSQSIGSLVGQVEAHLAANPKDGAGWEVLAPVYMRLGRFNDAGQRHGARKPIALNGDDATREAAFGEALVAAANGVVTDQALTAFQHAVAADPHELPRPAISSALPTSRPANLTSPRRNGARCSTARHRMRRGPISCGRLWRASPRRRIPPRGRAKARVSAPIKAQIGTPIRAQARPGCCGERKSRMPSSAPTWRAAWCKRLADRLHGDGGTVDEWLRLVQAYVINGDRDKAKGAVTDASAALADHSRLDQADRRTRH